MESPIEEIDSIIYKLTTGSPRLQQQTLEHYFTPNASFTHPFCAVNGNRNQILSIFRWYKVLSPKIEIKVNGISHEEQRQRLYIDISQTFRLWPLIPLGYRADVNLVTVLQLTRDPSGRDPGAERAIKSSSDKTPSYGTNALTATSTSPFTPHGTEKPPSALQKPETVKYWIKSQNDLYQTTEFAKFASLTGLLPFLLTLFHVFATWCCVLGAWIFTPFINAMQTFIDKQVEHRARVRSDPAFGPNFGGDMTSDERRSQKQLDVWEMEARFLRGSAREVDAGKMEGKQNGRKGQKQGLVGDFMKMEASR